jgi:uncharacterized protein YjbI with pentapeptide repeats
MGTEGKRDRSFWFELARVLLTPLMIALASGWVTMSINRQQQENVKIMAEAQMQNAKVIAEAQMQNAKVIADGEMENTKIIADGQMKNAKTIADAQIENAKESADAEIEVAKIGQVKEIFKQIYIQNPELPKEEVVAALAVYGKTALPFLIRAHAYGQQLNDQMLLEESEKAIALVLGSVQLNLENVDLSGKSLRIGDFRNLNLKGANFEESNLYKADLGLSNLIEANFTNADLHLSNFKNANLNKAIFQGANVRRAKFQDAKLDKADFQGAKHVEDAEFTPSSLKDAIFDKQDIIKLMKKYNVEIEQDKYQEGLFQLLIKKHELQRSDLEQ